MKKLVDVLGISFLFLFGLFSVGVCAAFCNRSLGYPLDAQSYLRNGGNCYGAYF